MAIQAAPFTPLCDDGKVGLSHVAHEQQDVDMPGLPAEKKNGNSVRNSIFILNPIKMKVWLLNHYNWCTPNYNTIDSLFFLSIFLLITKEVASVLSAIDDECKHV